MRRLTSFLMLVLMLFCAGMSAQVTPLTNIADGQYRIMCPAVTAYAYYDGTNAYLRRTPTVSEGTTLFQLTQGTGTDAGKYTIMCGELYVVAGSALGYSSTPGNNIKLVDAAEATDANKWWVLAQDASNSNYVDIFPYQENITSTTAAWNFAATHDGHDGGANTAVGFYDAANNNSNWVLLDINRSISVNFGGGSGEGKVAEGMINVTAAGWNNLSASGNTRSDLLTWNGSTTETLSPNWSVTWAAGATWNHKTDVTENILKGYLDDSDSNQATVTFTKLPFTSGYDLYIYKAADSYAKFSSVSVTFGGNTYDYTTESNGVAIFGTDKWGQSQQAVSAMGTNVICVKGLTAAEITVKGGIRSDGRGAIAAIQIVETGQSNVITVSGDTFDATNLEAPVYLTKEGDLNVLIASEASRAKYVDVTGVTGTVTYTVNPILEQKDLLRTTLTSIAAQVGPALGQYTTNANYTAAWELLNSEESTLEQLTAENAHPATYYYTTNLPQAGVGYVIKNKAYSTYMTADETNLRNWEGQPSPVYFEVVDGETEKFYIKVNGKYVGSCEMSTTVAMVDDKASAHPYSIVYMNGYNVMQDLLTSSDHAYLHSVVDNNRRVVGWSTDGDATQWTILSADESLTEAANLLNVAITTMEVNFGDNPFQYSNVDSGVAMDAAKVVRDNASATLEEICQQISTLKTTYTLNPFTPGYYRFKGVARENAYLYSDGSNVKWKELDENDATMVWHVSAVSGSSLTISNYGDGKIPQSTSFATAITMGTDANASVIYELISAPQVKVKFNGLQGACANDDGGVTNYNTGANENGVWYLERLDYLEQFLSLGFTAADKFTIAEGSVVKYPNEFSFETYDLTPEGINTAIDALVAVESTLAAQEAFMATDNGKLLLRYRKFLNDYPTYPLGCVNVELKGEYGTMILPLPVVRPAELEAFTCAGVESNNTTLTLTPMTGNFDEGVPYIIKGTPGSKFTFIGFDKAEKTTHTVGCLTGVLTEGGVTVPDDSYVLSKYNGVLAFYQVASGAGMNCPQFKCYFTAPSGMAVNAFYFSEDDVTTGIDIIEGNSGKTEIYDLFGRRLNNLQKGVNIVNGRKVVVK